MKMYNAHEVLEFQLANWSTQIPARNELPLLLVSQVQRSGGSLMMQLLDGHPSLRTFPNELDNLKGLGPDAWLSRLGQRPPAASILEPWVYKARFGYSKMSGNMSHLQTSRDHLEPFFFSFQVFERAYRTLLADCRSEKEVLDAYLSAFFHAWLNDANSVGNKHYLAAFAPGAMKRGSSEIQRFLDLDPRGKLVSVIRDPFSWYASAQRHSSRYGTIEQAIGLWSTQVAAHVEVWERHPDRVLLLLFTDVVAETAQTMEALAGFLGIPDDPITRIPTFNRKPYWSNSSFQVKRGEIDKATITRGEEKLSISDQDYIEKNAGELFWEIQNKILAARH